MLIKMQLCLLKNMLYVAQVVECGTITKVAQKNGIKASNLSKLIKDTEKELGSALFIRTNKGLIPTEKALDISKKVNKIQEMIVESAKCFVQRPEINPISIYVSNGLEINSLGEVCPNAVFCENEQNADVIISNKEPINVENRVILNTKIGKEITQNLFICAKDTPQAREVITSIILMFQHK